MKPIRQSISVVRWVFLLALAIAAASPRCAGPVFRFLRRLWNWLWYARVPERVLWQPAGYDYVTPNDVYGTGGIDYYGSSALGYGGNQGMGYDSGSGYGYSAFGSGGPAFGAPIAAPVLVQGQNAEGAQGPANQRKAPRKAPARAKKSAGAAAGAGAERKAP